MNVDEWSLYSRELRDGWRIEVHPLTFRRARIVITDGDVIRDGW